MTIHSKLNRRKKSKEKSNFLKKYFVRASTRLRNEIIMPPIRKRREYLEMRGFFLQEIGLFIPRAGGVKI